MHRKRLKLIEHSVWKRQSNGEREGSQSAAAGHAGGDPDAVLLVQGAHPLVYTRVVARSAYAGDQFAGRILRTGRTLRALALAPRPAADRLLRVVREMHGRVRGRLKYEGGPPYPQGTPFWGPDLSLLQWPMYGVYDWFVIKSLTFTTLHDRIREQYGVAKSRARAALTGGAGASSSSIAPLSARSASGSARSATGPRPTARVSLLTR
jgi:hypothetical protein